MSAYEHDDRVAPYGTGFTVAECVVLPTISFGWTICHLGSLAFVQTDDGPAVGYGDADDAIQALIGDPQ